MRTLPRWILLPAGLGALLWWKAGSPDLAAAMLAGIVATLAVLALLAWACWPHAARAHEPPGLSR